MLSVIGRCESINSAQMQANQTNQTKPAIRNAKADSGMPFGR
jgi:hypothetical protein